MISNYPAGVTNAHPYFNQSEGEDVWCNVCDDWSYGVLTPVAHGVEEFECGECGFTSEFLTFDDEPDFDGE